MKSIPRKKVDLSFMFWVKFTAKAINFQKIIPINMLWCIFWWSPHVNDNLCSEHGNRLLKTRARTEAAYCVLTIICFRWTFLPTMKTLREMITNLISQAGAWWSNHDVHVIPNHVALSSKSESESESEDLDTSTLLLSQACAHPHLSQATCASSWSSSSSIAMNATKL